MPKTFIPVPHCRQERPETCVPACARIVLTHYGHPVSEREPAELFSIFVFGTNAWHLFRLIQRGFRVEMEQSSIARLQSFLDVGIPVIAFLRTEHLPYWQYATPHAVVVCGYEDEDVFLADPCFDDYPQIVTFPQFE